MKTAKEIRKILDSCPRVDVHIHTHLCDGSSDMTAQNIADRARKMGIGGVVLTPHFHKRVSDVTEVLYEDTDENIFLALRDEIDFYNRHNGAMQMLLSAEVDILNLDGTLAMQPSAKLEKVLDCITPTMNFHPLLPLCAVHLTYGRDIRGLHENGNYIRMAKQAGGISTVLETMYECETNAMLKSPYPSILGHFFAAHSMAVDNYNWFGVSREHMSIMRSGGKRVIEACKKVNGMVDITGIHMMAAETVPEKQKRDGFLYEFQKYFTEQCKAADIPAFPGSDAHSISGIGASLCYYELGLSEQSG